MANRNGQNHASKPDDLSDLGARLDAAKSKHQIAPESKDDVPLGDDMPDDEDE